jgi:hypothetical protein
MINTPNELQENQMETEIQVGPTGVTDLPMPKVPDHAPVAERNAQLPN